MQSVICCTAPAGGRLAEPPRLPAAEAGLLAAATELALVALRAGLPLSVDRSRESTGVCAKSDDVVRLLVGTATGVSSCCIAETDPGDRKYMGPRSTLPACTDNFVQAGEGKTA